MNLGKKPFENGKKAMDFIFFSMFSGQLIFASVAYLLVNENVITSDINPDLIKIAVVSLNVVLIIISKVLSVKFLKTGSNLNDKREVKKIDPVYLVILALIEGANLANIVAFILTGDYVFLLIFVMVLVYFYTNRLGLTKTKINQVNRKE